MHSAALFPVVKCVEVCACQIDVGLSMICYTETQKIQERVFGRNPIKRTHGKVIVFAKVNSKLCFEVGKRVKFVCGVEVFVIFAVRTLYFTVMARGEWSDQLVGNLSLFERALKERKIAGRGAAEAFGKLKSVVGLDAFHGKAELFEVIEHMDEELRRGIGAVFFKSFEITIP